MISKLRQIDSKTSQAIVNVLAVEALCEAKQHINETIIARLKLKSGKFQIFCLFPELSIKWRLPSLLENDEYPNPIIGDSEHDENADTWEKACLPNDSAFVISSFRGITMTVNYANGNIINSVLTK